MADGSSAGDHLGLPDALGLASPWHRSSIWLLFWVKAQFYFRPVCRDSRWEDHVGCGRLGPSQAVPSGLAPAPLVVREASWPCPGAKSGTTWPPDTCQGGLRAGELLPSGCHFPGSWSHKRPHTSGSTPTSITCTHTVTHTYIHSHIYKHTYILTHIACSHIHIYTYAYVLTHFHRQT